jgi:hypothetical protein
MHIHCSWCFCHFLKASWKSSSLRAFSITWNSTSNASVVWKWQYYQSGKQRKATRGQVRCVGWTGDDNLVVFHKRTPWWKIMHCHDVTANSFVAKVWDEVFVHFHTVAVKCHSSVRNCLCGLPTQILCEQYPRCKIWGFHGGDYEDYEEKVHNCLWRLEYWRIVSSGMLRRVALVRTDVSEELGIYLQHVSVASCS